MTADAHLPDIRRNLAEASRYGLACEFTCNPASPGEALTWLADQIEVSILPQELQVEVNGAPAFMLHVADGLVLQLHAAAFHKATEDIRALIGVPLETGHAGALATLLHSVAAECGDLRLRCTPLEPVDAGQNGISVSQIFAALELRVPVLLPPTEAAGLDLFLDIAGNRLLGLYSAPEDLENPECGDPLPTKVRGWVEATLAASQTSKTTATDTLSFSSLADYPELALGRAVVEGTVCVLVTTSDAAPRLAHAWVRQFQPILPEPS